MKRRKNRIEKQIKKYLDKLVQSGRAYVLQIGDGTETKHMLNLTPLSEEQREIINKNTQIKLNL